MQGAQDCPLTNCHGKKHGKIGFQPDEELMRRIIKKSCSEEDSQSALNNGDDTAKVAGSRRENQSLTSG
jgi:hypothetical protein